MRPVSRRAQPRPRLLVALLPALALALAACGVGASSSPGTSPGPSVSPSASPSQTPVAGIEHPTGAAELVLRFEEGGGFMAPGFLATEGPIFTLLGDGTAIFQDATATQPPQSGAVFAKIPYVAVRLAEAQVQELLAYAIGPGALGIARASYENGQIADAPTATFTLHAGGLTKTVSVYALGLDTGGGPDAAIRNALAALGGRLRDFGAEVTGETTWTPDRYRGVLQEGLATGPGAPWPWSGVAPTDFSIGGLPGDSPFPVRVMTPAEIAVLRVTPFEGGFGGVSLLGPDGKAYLFACRPLLPDEAR